MIKYFLENDIPTIAYIEPTLRCNLTCPQCYVEKCIPQQNEELTRPEIGRVLDGLKELGTFIMVITGGEPFMRPDLLDLIEDMRSRHFAVVIFTNGTLITPAIAGQLYKHAPLGVEVSVHGPTAVVHDRIAGVSGAFEQALTAIRLLKENRVRVKIKGNLMTLNNGDYERLIDLADRLKVEYTFDPFIYPARDRNPAPAALRMERAGLKKVLGEPRLYPPVKCDSAKAYLDIPENRLCGAGANVLNISSNGDVFPCVPFKLRCGNVREAVIETVWKESPVLRNLRSLKVGDLTACGECSVRQGCVYCMAKAYNETGEFLQCADGLRSLAVVRAEIHA